MGCWVEENNYSIRELPMPVTTIGHNPPPTPNFRRLMVFIDGENLVFSFEKMLKDGLIPRNNTIHEKNIFAWNENTIDPKMFEVLRVTLYTYAVGSDEVIESTNQKNKELTFNKVISSALPINITPIVFKKNKKNKKTKGVDIKMTVDILTHCYNDNLDTVMIVAGDGDYLPIIEEAKRMGKQVYLAFFSKGLNNHLIYNVDKYISLDDIYFKPK